MADSRNESYQAKHPGFPGKPDRAPSARGNAGSSPIRPHGYRHVLYAQSFAEFGEPVELPRCGGWIVRRDVPATDARDALGCYPLFCCSDWSRLEDDLTELADTLVSLVIVVDPMATVSRATLNQSFDVVSTFKTHHVVDLTRPVESVASRHHRYYARRGLKRVEVHVHPDPPAFVDEWVALYAHLVERKQLTGIRAFSRDAFALQLQVPGTFLLFAVCEGRVVGADWYYLDGRTAYAHLAAFSEAGYANGASYALQWRAIELLREAGARTLDLGGAPGLVEPGAADGQTQFKRGWSTSTAQAVLAARIFDRERYDELSGDMARQTDYIPAYRADEPT